MRSRSLITALIAALLFTTSSNLPAAEDQDLLISRNNKGPLNYQVTAAMNSRGHFVVTWTETERTSCEITYSRVLAAYVKQKKSGSFKARRPRRLSKADEKSQAARIVYNPDSNSYMIAWERVIFFNEYAERDNIITQELNKKGKPSGGMNNITPDFVGNSFIQLCRVADRTTSPTGKENYLVVWSKSYVMPGEEKKMGIYSQFLDNNGAAIGKANQFVEVDYYKPEPDHYWYLCFNTDICRNADGTYLVGADRNMARSKNREGYLYHLDENGELLSTHRFTARKGVHTVHFVHLDDEHILTSWHRWQGKNTGFVNQVFTTSAEPVGKSYDPMKDANSFYSLLVTLGKSDGVCQIISDQNGRIYYSYIDEDGQQVGEPVLLDNNRPSRGYKLFWAQALPDTDTIFMLYTANYTDDGWIREVRARVFDVKIPK